MINEVILIMKIYYLIIYLTIPYIRFLYLYIFKIFIKFISIDIKIENHCYAKLLLNI